MPSSKIVWPKKINIASSVESLPDWRAQGLHFYWIHSRAHDRLVGHFTAYTPPGEHNHVLAINYMVLPDYRNRHIAAEAIELFTERALAKGAAYVCAETGLKTDDQTNLNPIASGKSLLCAGFKDVGTGICTLLPPDARYYPGEHRRFMKTSNPALTAWPMPVRA